MENSFLNRAHQQHRRADSHMRCKRFAEAIECHKNAAELLAEALSCTTNPRSIESIKLQHDFHLRQKDIVAVKKEQFENYRRAIENQRNRIAYCGNDYEISNDNQSTSLQVAIYRTMEEADSLLGQLIKRGNGGSDSESLRSFSTTDTDDKAVSLDAIDSPNSNNHNVVGCKHPKDETVVIEELRTLNEQLHSLVYQLVTQLDASTREVDMLKEKVKQLEGEKYKGTSPDIPFAQTHKSSTNNLKVVTDSSGGTSPFVFSPCSEFSPEASNERHQQQQQRVLPTLAPLEMPTFDFTGFVRHNANNPSLDVDKL